MASMTETEYEDKIQQLLDDDFYDEAASLCNELMTRFPKNGTAHGKLAEVHLFRREPEKAIAELDKAIALDPENATFSFSKAEALIYMKKENEAVELIQETLKQHPHDIDSLRQGCDLYSLLKRFNEALELANRAYAMAPKDVKVIISLADIHDYMGNSNAALDDYEEALKIEPDNYDVWNYRSSVYILRNEPMKALEDATHSISLNPESPFAYVTKAHAYLLLGNLREADEICTDIIQRFPSLPKSYYVRGAILEQKQEFQKALESYEKFLGLNYPDFRIVDDAAERVRLLKEKFVRMSEKKKDESGTRYHVFLSHYQRTGGLLAMVLKLLLERKHPRLKAFLDVDDLEDIHDLKENVKNSDNFMLLLTEGVFERRFVIEEITTALELKKNIILVWDKERCPWPDVNKIPENLRNVLLIRAIIWNAEKDFREVVVSQILSKMGGDVSWKSSEAVQTQVILSREILVQYNDKEEVLLTLSAEADLEGLRKLVQENSPKPLHFFVLKYFDKDFFAFVEFEHLNKLPQRSRIRVYGPNNTFSQNM